MEDQQIEKSILQASELELEKPRQEMLNALAQTRKTHEVVKEKDVQVQ